MGKTGKHSIHELRKELKKYEKLLLIFAQERKLESLNQLQLLKATFSFQRDEDAKKGKNLCRVPVGEHRGVWWGQRSSSVLPSLM